MQAIFVVIARSVLHLEYISDIGGWYTIGSLSIDNVPHSMWYIEFIKSFSS